MLASRLRFLERHGLISRKSYPTVPPRTEYSLTELGRGLDSVIGAMADYGRALPPSPDLTPSQETRA